MKKIAKNIFGFFGFDIIKKQKLKPGSDFQPVGEFTVLLNDLKHRGLKCSVMLDVGANKAEWSVLFKSVYPKAQCVLIEPLVECEKELKDFVSIYKDSRYFLVAAGSENIRQNITIWDDLYGSSLLPHEDETKKSSGKQREISVVKVDNLIKEHKLAIPELVKIDVQGFELEALKGASCIFGKTEVIILEVSLYSFDDVPGMPEFYEVIKYMFDRDYVVYDFPGFLRRPFDGALGQCDICFVKKNGFLRKSKKWS